MFFTAKATSPRKMHDSVDGSTASTSSSPGSQYTSTIPLVASAISKLALCLPALDTAVAAVSSYLDSTSPPSTNSPNASQRPSLMPIITTSKTQIYTSPRGPHSLLGLCPRATPARRMTAPLAPPVLTPTSSPNSPNRDDMYTFIMLNLNSEQTHHSMAFVPMTPISECPEPSSPVLSLSPLSLPSSASLPIQPSPVLISPAADGEVSYFDLIIPMAPSAEYISYFSHLDSTTSITSSCSEKTLQEDLLAFPPSPASLLLSPFPELMTPTPRRDFVDSALYRRILSGTSLKQDNVDITPPTPTSLSFPPSLRFSASASTESTPTRLPTPVGLSLLSQQYLHIDDGLSLSNSYFSQQAWNSVFTTVCDKDKDRLVSTYQSIPLSTTSSNLSSFSSLTASTSSVPFVFDPFGCNDDGNEDITSLTSVQYEHVGVDMMRSLLDLDGTSIKHTLMDPVPFVFAPVGLPHEEPTSGVGVPEEHGHMGGLPTGENGMLAPTNLLPEVIDHTDLAPDLHKCVMSWADSDSDELDTTEDTTVAPPTILTHNGISYTVTGELGSGTYGQVVFARTSLGEEVAIKITSKITGASNTPEKLRKFILNERNILVRIAGDKSPFLAKPLACFQDEDNVFFVMRMYPKNLAQIIRKSNLYDCPLPLAQIKSYAADLLLGLEALHSMHIVHRDLKPDNVLVSPNGHLAIADFGFAKQCPKDQWANGRISGAMGTPGYIAPEILFPHFATDGCSYAIDTWGFGMILLELFLGEPYISGGSVVQREYRNRLAPFVVSHDIDRRVQNESAADLLKLILKREAVHRPSWAQIRAHEFFADVDWKAVKSRKPSSHIAKPTLDHPAINRPQPASQGAERVFIKDTLLNFDCSDKARFDFLHGRTILYS